MQQIEVTSVRQRLSSFRHAMTAEDVAELLNVHKITVYRAVKANTIPHKIIGGSLRFDPGAIAAWWEKR